MCTNMKRDSHDVPYCLSWAFQRRNTSALIQGFPALNLKEEFRHDLRSQSRLARFSYRPNSRAKLFKMSYSPLVRQDLA